MKNIREWCHVTKILISVTKQLIITCRAFQLETASSKWHMTKSFLTEAKKAQSRLHLTEISISVRVQVTKERVGEGCTTSPLSQVWILRFRIKWTGYSCRKMDTVWITAIRMSHNSPQLVAVWAVTMTRLQASLTNAIGVNSLRKVLTIVRGAGWSTKEQRRVSSISAPRTETCKATNPWNRQKGKTVWIMLCRMIKTQSRLSQLLRLPSVWINLIRTSMIAMMLTRSIEISS